MLTIAEFFTKIINKTIEALEYIRDYILGFLGLEEIRGLCFN